MTVDCMHYCNRSAVVDAVDDVDVDIVDAGGGGGGGGFFILGHVQRFYGRANRIGIKLPIQVDLHYTRHW